MSEDSGLKLTIPAYGKSSAISLDLSKTKEAEARLIEAKMVNPSTYADLECTYNEAYRELKRNYSTIGYELDMADKSMEMIKSVLLLDEYPEFMQGRPKGNDSADTRKAFLMKSQEYLDALDRIAMLKAMESMLDGKIKVFERTCAYMKKQMDLIIRSGLSGTNLYNTQGRK